MIPGFFGPTRTRQINLGGSSTTYSPEAILDTVRQHREQRQDLRRRQESASRIQAWWRGTSEARKVRAYHRAEFDRTAGPSVEWTRLLVVGWAGNGDDQQRLARWSQIMLEGGEVALFGPLSTPQAQSWLVLLRQASLILLKSISTNPQSSQALSHAQVLSEIIDLKRPTCLNVTNYLLERDFYKSLSRTLLSISPEAKSTPCVPLVASLVTRPFSVFSTESTQYRAAFLGLLQHILTIPILPNRLPLEILTRFSSHLPFLHLNKLSPVASLVDAVQDLPSRLHLLANLGAFVPPRLPKLSGPALGAYIQVLSSLMDSVPAGSLEPLTAATPVNSWAAQDDSDTEERLSPKRLASGNPTTSTSSPVLKLDSRTLTRLQIIPSPNHLTNLLTLTSKHRETRALLFYFFLSICAAWPGRKDRILSTINVSKEGANVVKEIWRGWVRGSSLGKEGRGLQELAALTDPANTSTWPPLLFLVDLYTLALLTMGDDEFFSTNVRATAARNPFSLDELSAFSRQLLNIAFPLYWHEDQEILKEGTVPGVGMRTTWVGVRERVTKCLKAIHTRDSRRKFTPADHWLLTSHFDMQSFAEAAIFEEQKLGRAPSSRDISKRQMAYLSPRLGILNNIPFAIPFSARVEIFRRFVWNDMKESDVDSTLGGFLGPPRHRAVVRRGQVAKDGYDGLNPLGAALKERVQITFIDQFGNEESGIDGGGVFKEFLTSLSKEVFDTDRGLWLATRRQELYPNPHSYATETHQLNWYRFIGRVLGKALYEGILIDVVFAPFFLAKWLGRQSYLDDLASLDPELYQGLIFLKHYEGKVEDLALNFTVANDEFGVTKTLNLIPNGENVQVTKENRIQYIYLVSNYRLNTQIKLQSEALFDGLSDIIDPKWLRMFNQQELQVLIGGTEGPIDVDDLRQNTVYGGLFDENHETIQMFWRVVYSLNSEQRRALLRFSTSCSRPPLLGFKELNPKFSIRDSGSDDNRLPTTSTCVNLLKLPRYSNEASLRRKLLQAIHSGAGFDLS